MLKNLDTIIVTAHGNKDEIGEAISSFMDATAEQFAAILNDANFGGNVYFHVCDGYEYGCQVKDHLTCNATIYGAEGEAGTDIDLDDCKLCN